MTGPFLRFCLRSLGALALASAAPGCAARGPVEAPVATVEVEPARALELRRRAEGFYLRLAHRRFNTLETYNDFIMRDHFQTLDLFFDYYADFAEDLSDAHFEKSRPDVVEVLEFRFEDPDNAQVEVRFVGEDGRPLRPDTTEVVRADRWERSESTWWIRPGKL